MAGNFNIALDFAAAANRNPESLAIKAGNTECSYGALADMASRLGARFAAGRGSGRVGILATRSVEAYAGILGAAWAGSTYVPLNLKWPHERLLALMQAMQLDALVADRNGAALLTDALIAAVGGPVVVADDVDCIAHARIVRFAEIGAQAMAEPAKVGPEHPAYIIFTSGTTGMPKGVVISAASLAHYLDQTEGWTRFTADDRIGECCDVTFDLTVHNMFLAWRAGASLHLMSQLELMAPARFIRAKAITAWLSVPTIAGTMQRMGMLKPGVFPSLRLSVFCGEPLPVTTAQAWAAAAPNGTVENIYGPTEGTVICMRQTLTDPPAVTEGRGIVAIGRPYATMQVAILDAAQNPVEAGEPGEIALSGPQLAIGYFNAPEQTAERFRTIRGERWYLTGDLGRQDADGTFHHLGRVDNQVKVKGNRIELEEVEAHLRDAARTTVVAAIAWPVVHGSAEGLVGFCAGTGLQPQEIRERMRRTLPEYMIPADIRVTDTLPVNVNGKVDRRALAEQMTAALDAAE
ncbi:MAG: amino acid adenylation domain-containing protein [Rhizobiaceae bacterium]